MALASASGGNRIDAIDIARGIALLAMAIYHFTWDLEFFGYAEPGLTAVGGWKLFARAIASSFSSSSASAFTSVIARKSAGSHSPAASP